MATKKLDGETAEEQLQAARKLTPDERMVKIAKLESRVFNNDGTAITPYLAGSAVIAAIVGLLGAFVLAIEVTASNHEASRADGQVSTQGSWDFLSSWYFWAIALIALAVLLVLCLLAYTLQRQPSRTYAQAVIQELCIYRLVHEEVETPDRLRPPLTEEDRRIRLWLFRETLPAESYEN